MANSSGLSIRGRARHGRGTWTGTGLVANLKVPFPFSSKVIENCATVVVAAKAEAKLSAVRVLVSIFIVSLVSEPGTFIFAA
jgi:hypothetical protein